VAAMLGASPAIFIDHAAAPAQVVQVPGSRRA
jgi:hypothetical protein